MTTNHNGSPDMGLPLIEAGKHAGVTISSNASPVDKFIELNGLRFHYLDWGGNDKPWMVCLHGGSQNAHMWDFTALAFSDRFHIVALDQRGHGDSDWAPDGNYSATAHQGDITSFISALQIDSFIMVGLSMGGHNSFRFTSNNPSLVRSLVVVDIGPESRRQGGERIRDFVTQDDVLDSFDDFVERTKLYDPNRPEWQIRGSLRHALRQLPDGRWTWKYDKVLRDPIRRSAASADRNPELLWELWCKIQCPTLLVRGGESDILDREIAEEMERRLPSCQLVEIEKAGHRVPGDNPIAFEAALGRFLAQFS